MVFGHHHHIASAGSPELLGPRVGVPAVEFPLEHFAEPLIGHVPICRSMKLVRRRSGHSHRVGVGLGVRADCHRPVVVVAQDLRVRGGRRKAWDREQPPMNEHAELRVGEPVGHRMLSQ